ncbi:MAG: hypothetical protein D6692_00615 [Planctomycetota bacterium]|nr:MAG: hypothetical protein D6692_00615 [Planctomycetota bacterium]
METLLIAGLGLLALSILLIVLEAFVPSGGIIAATSAICAVAGVVALFRVSNTWGFAGLLTVIVLGPMAFLWGLKMLPSTPIGRRLLGPTASEIARASIEREKSEREARLALIGAEGVALTALRPVGVVEIDGVRHDAKAEVGLIDRGTPIRVTGVDGMQIRVRAV